jgi:hypothetical protein
MALERAVCRMLQNDSNDCWTIVLKAPSPQAIPYQRFRSASRSGCGGAPKGRSWPALALKKKHSMNLRTIDLNLLVIFDAIAAERSIGRAAEKVGLSQSAMSHARRRLRRTFNDDLIRRTSEGMELTPRSLALAETVRGALAMIEQAVDAEVHFDPKRSQRRFNIRVSDYIAVRLLSGICARSVG